MSIYIHLHRLNDPQDIPDSTAHQRHPNDLGQQRDAAVCSQTEHDKNNDSDAILTITNM